MLKHSGPARIFSSEEDAFQTIVDGKINKGEVLVVRYEGPKGGLGMQENALAHLRPGGNRYR